MGEIKSMILVKYACVDNAHVFTSGDPSALGLCVMHKDLEIAFAEVGHQLSYIFKVNTGKKVKFLPSMPLSKFKEWLQKVDETAIDEIKPIPAGVTQWSQHSLLEAA